MAKPTLTDIDLGKIETEDIQIVMKIPSVSLPITNTDENVNITLLGKKRIITITGVQTGEGLSGATIDARINTFLESVEYWINTRLQEARTYTDSFGNTYSVVCLDFVRKRDELVQGKIDYTMTLMEGGLTL